MSQLDGIMDLVWQCGMGEACTNKERPGIHGGDHGERDAGICCGKLEPEEPEPQRPVELRSRR